MNRSRQHGFAAIAAIVLLVVVAGISAAMLRLTSVQQDTVNQAVLGARASQAARAGVEWMIYRIANDGGATACPAGQTLSDFLADTGFRVTVTCTARTPFNEGEAAPGVPVVKHIYQVDAVACNGAASSCPDNGSVQAPDYAERRRTATVCMTSDSRDCY
ncbi:MSHA biogenesis protein MshP [Massilia consociata]|uniref:MSHA biogenesis protein MshP n=1 Tax=Massilia consociata TaxID=760117 RepID=A0ABV6FJ09_9BURK